MFLSCGVLLRSDYLSPLSKVADFYEQILHLISEAAPVERSFYAGTWPTDPVVEGDAGAAGNNI